MYDWERPLLRLLSEVVMLTSTFRPLWIVRVLSVLVLAAALLASSCHRSGSICSQCGRMECSNMVFTIHLENGEKRETCCPRCGLHYIASEHPRVASLTVRDFDSTRTLDAYAAVYVDGSDVTPCTMMDEAPPKDERGCCLRTVYDRCSPSLIPFASRDSAERFAREHGGIVKTFDEVRGAGPAPSRSSG